MCKKTKSWTKVGNVSKIFFSLQNLWTYRFFFGALGSRPSKQPLSFWPPNSPGRGPQPPTAQRLNAGHEVTKFFYTETTWPGPVFWWVKNPQVKVEVFTKCWGKHSEVKTGGQLPNQESMRKKQRVKTLCEKLNVPRPRPCSWKIGQSWGRIVANPNFPCSERLWGKVPLKTSQLTGHPMELLAILQRDFWKIIRSLPSHAISGRKVGWKAAKSSTPAVGCWACCLYTASLESWELVQNCWQVYTPLVGRAHTSIQVEIP